MILCCMYKIGKVIHIAAENGMDTLPLMGDNCIRRFSNVLFVFYPNKFLVYYDIYLKYADNVNSCTKQFYYIITHGG